MSKDFSINQRQFITQALKNINTLPPQSQLTKLTNELNKAFNQNKTQQQIQLFIQYLITQQEFINAKHNTHQKSITIPIIKPITHLKQNQQIKQGSPISKQVSHLPQIEVNFTKKKMKKSIKCYSRRKVKPTEQWATFMGKSVDEKCQIIDQFSLQCHTAMQRRGRKTNNGQMNAQARWIMNEYFYSSYDGEYFQLMKEVMRKILRVSGLGILLNDLDARNTLQVYNRIKKALPKPHLLNYEFIEEQIKILNKYRNMLRTSKNKNRQQIIFTPNKQIIGLHPMCGHIHSGIIISIYRQTQCLIKFHHAQLGTQKLLDTNILLKYSTSEKIVTDGINYQIMSILIKLLEFKSQLIQTLKKYNNKAYELNESGLNFDNTFLQEYGWIGSTISILSLGIKNILFRFRLRGINNQNECTIIKNISSLLHKPYELIINELQNSNDHSDLQAAIKFKSYINNNRDSQIKHKLQQILNSNQTFVNKQIYNVLSNCIGILISLQLQGKYFSITNNSYLKQLNQNIYNNLPQYSNDIHQQLLEILKFLQY